MRRKDRSFESCKLMAVPYFYTELRLGLGSPKIFLTSTSKMRFTRFIKGSERVVNIKKADTYAYLNIP
jgi:hypothetical protein